MVSPLGGDVETSWSRLLEGQSGAVAVDSFDTSDLPCRVGCVVRNGDGTDGTLDADRWMEPKEQRKVDPFIIYAVSAASQALADAGWAPKTYEDQVATGVLIG